MDMQDEKYQQRSKSISSEEPNYFVHFAMRYPVQDGECELCERYIKLTRHHLIPRVTWKKMKKRLLNISDARSKCDSNRLTALIQGMPL